MRLSRMRLASMKLRLLMDSKVYEDNVGEEGDHDDSEGKQGEEQELHGGGERWQDRRRSWICIFCQVWG